MYILYRLHAKPQVDLWITMVMIGKSQSQNSRDYNFSLDGKSLQVPFC